MKQNMKKDLEIVKGIAKKVGIFIIVVIAYLLSRIWAGLVYIYQKRGHIKKFFKRNIWKMGLVLSICWICLLLHLNAKQHELIILQDQLIQEQRQYIKEQSEIIQDVIKTKKEIEKVKPKLNQGQLWREACIFVGKVRSFQIPLDVALLSARAESNFDPNVHGPCGEWGTHQATYWTMRKYFPRANARELIYWEVASWVHLEECWQKAQGDTFLTLAYHNAGMNWSRPERAMRAAWKHLSRCRDLYRKMDLNLIEVV